MQYVLEMIDINKQFRGVTQLFKGDLEGCIQTFEEYPLENYDAYDVQMLLRNNVYYDFTTNDLFILREINYTNDVEVGVGVK